jgi:hypothetical protein
VGFHYSGNFWWAKSEHIMYLENKIGPGYVDPENWIMTKNKRKAFCVFNSGYQGMGHYKVRYPREKYATE